MSVKWLRRSRFAATELASLIERLVSTIRKTPSGGYLSWEIEVPPEIRVAVDRDDLAELLGSGESRARVRQNRRGDGYDLSR